MSSPFHILFDSTNAYVETGKILDYIDAYAKACNLDRKLIVNPDSIYSVLTVIYNDFPHYDGINASSPFKKVGCFLSYFIAGKPINDTISTVTIGDLHKKPNSANAMIGFQFCIDSLHGASIYRDNRCIELINPIKISLHSYIDIIEALLSVTPSEHFKLVTVLLEQLAYRANPKASYDEFIEAN